MSHLIAMATDMGEVGSARRLEIPIQGPGGANLLVLINGITLKGADTDQDFESREFTTVDFFVDTDYKLRDDDVLLDSSAFVCLSSINADDVSTFLLALDETMVVLRTSRVIQLRVRGAMEGDAGIYRIGYQVNLSVLRSG